MGITAISDITGDSVPSNLVVVNDYPIHIIAKFNNKDMNYVGYSTSDNGMICSNFGIITLEADQDSRLADTVGYSEEEITFSFAYEDVDACTEANKENYEEKVNWVSIPGTQTTQHLIYRLGGVPTPAPDSQDDIFLKIIDMSCDWADGKNAPNDIFDQILRNFWTPIIGTGAAARPDNANGFKGVGDPVETERPDMWGNSPKCFTYQHNMGEGKVFSVDYMLDENAGRCEAWARFLIAFTRIHGLNARLVALPYLKYIHVHNGEESYMLEGEQLLTSINPSLFGDVLLVPVAIHVNKNGQANPYEAGHLEEYFADGDHAIVNINGRYYDPSYEHPSGASYNTINEYADNSIDHFMYLVHRCDIAGRWIPDVFETRCNFDEIDEFFEEDPL